MCFTSGMCFAFSYLGTAAAAAAVVVQLLLFLLFLFQSRYLYLSMARSFSFLFLSFLKSHFVCYSAMKCTRLVAIRNTWTLSNCGDAQYECSKRWAEKVEMTENDETLMMELVDTRDGWFYHCCRPVIVN